MQSTQNLKSAIFKVEVSRLFRLRNFQNIQGRLREDWCNCEAVRKGCRSRVLRRALVRILVNSKYAGLAFSSSYTASHEGCLRLLLSAQLQPIPSSCWCVAEKAKKGVFRNKRPRLDPCSKGQRLSGDLPRLRYQLLLSNSIGMQQAGLLPITECVNV